MKAEADGVVRSGSRPSIGFANRAGDDMRAARKPFFNSLLEHFRRMPP